MIIAVTTTVTTPTSNAAVKRLTARLDRWVTGTAQAVQASANRAAPRDTGALSESIYIQTPEGSDYADRTATAEALQPRVPLFPEGAAPAPHSAVVAVAVRYGVYLEFGTAKMSAQPFFGPAVQDGVQYARKAMKADTLELVDG